MDYYKFGNGNRVMVMIPGLSINPVVPLGKLVENQYAVFKNDYTVYMIDRKAPAVEGSTIEDLADDYADMIRELGLDKVYLFGTSQGGQIAMALAIKYPELVEKLVLGSTSSKPTDLTWKSVGNWVRCAKELKGEELNAAMTDNCYSENTLKTRRDAIIAANADLSVEQLRQFVIKASPILDFDCDDRLGEIKCPVIVIGSDGDQVFGGDASRHIAEKLNCKLYMYGKEFGHCVYDEAPDYTIKLHELMA